MPLGMATTVRIAMLNVEAPVPNVRAERGATYGRIFHELLSQAAKRVAPHVVVQSVDFDVVHGEYPGAPGDDFDVLVITGSTALAYDDHSWIHELDRFISKVYHDSPKLKIFGSCFGHQIFCQSLLRDITV